MLKKIHTVIGILISICCLPQFTAGQTISELVQEGMNYYHEGEYGLALNYFNEALGITAFIQTDVQITNISDAFYVVANSGYYTGVSSKEYAGVSPIDHVIVQTREYTGVSPKYYVQEPFFFQEPNLAVIYNYRAKTYLQLGMTEKAFDDFDRVLFLDPLLSEIYFRKAVAYQEATGVDVCGELQTAMDMGYVFAKIYYNMLCEEN